MEAVLLDHVGDRGIAPDAEKHRKDAEKTCDAALFFGVKVRGTNGTLNGF